MRTGRPARPVATHVAPVARASVNTRHAAAAPFIPPANNNFDFGNGFFGGSGETIQQLLDPVPGLGFDYSYLAAIDKDLAIKAVIDPQTRERLAVAEQVARATGGFGAPGYYLLDGGGYVVPAEAGANEQPEQPQPEVIVLQQPAQKSAEEAAAAEASQPAQPVPDVGNFTLVLKNGKKIEAIAFIRFGDRIVYITVDGDRHAIAATDLNDAATQRVNADRGTQLTL